MKKITHKIINRLKCEYEYFTKKPKAIVFDHIPKCAGTTVHTFLRNYYPKRLIFEVTDKNAKINDFKNFSKKKRNRFKFIHGHFANLLFDFVRNDSVKVVVFREPIDRIISHYYFVKRRKDHRLHQQVFVNNNVLLKDYCSLIDSDELRNFYTKRYSGMSDEEIKNFPEKAMNSAFDSINNKYDIVGFQDNVTEFINKLIVKINLPEGVYQNEKINHTINRVSVDDMDTETINEIKKYNQLDIELYDKLREKFINNN